MREGRFSGVDNKIGVLRNAQQNRALNQKLSIRKKCMRPHARLTKTFRVAEDHTVRTQ